MSADRILSAKEVAGLSLIAAATGLSTEETRKLLDSHEALRTRLTEAIELLKSATTYPYWEPEFDSFQRARVFIEEQTQ